MKEHYTIFCIFKLEPAYFYLFINFVDLVFNNFNMRSTIIEITDKKQKEYQYLYKFELIMIKIVNNMNHFLVFFGIICFFIYIIKHKFKTRIHKFYAVIRTVICFIRSIVYFFTTFFYLKVWWHGFKAHYLRFNLAVSVILLAIEVFDVVWCFYLIEIVFRKKKKVVEDERLSQVGKADDPVENVVSEYSSQLISVEKFEEESVVEGLEQGGSKGLEDVGSIKSGVNLQNDTKL